MRAAELSCEESLRRLDDYLDRSLSPEDLRRVRVHLRECLDCASVFKYEATLIQGLRARLQRLSIPPGLAQSIRFRLRAERAAPHFDT